MVRTLVPRPARPVRGEPPRDRRLRCAGRSPSCVARYSHGKWRRHDGVSRGNDAGRDPGAPAVVARRSRRPRRPRRPRTRRLRRAGAAPHPSAARAAPRPVGPGPNRRLRRRGDARRCGRPGLRSHRPASVASPRGGPSTLDARDAHLRPSPPRRLGRVRARSRARCGHAFVLAHLPSVARLSWCCRSAIAGSSARNSTCAADTAATAKSRSWAMATCAPPPPAAYHLRPLHRRHRRRRRPPRGRPGARRGAARARRSRRRRDLREPPHARGRPPP